MRRKSTEQKYRFFANMLCNISIFLTTIFAVCIMAVTFKHTNDDVTLDNEYIAAVVEYVPVNTTFIKERVSINLFQYEQIIKMAKKSFVDLIVFPECGLVGCSHTDRDYVIKDGAVVVPAPELGIIPCQKKSYSNILSTLSCAAQQNSMYVVVNLIEKFYPPDEENNEKLPNKQSEILVYNTNVVFDRHGRIIARYRKYNLYAERTTLGINSTIEPELCTFTTDFGVTFGIIICFDIIFKQPSYTLLHEKNVSAIIFSGAVYSQLPFLVLTSLGAGWSYSMNTVLLFSDAPVRAGSFGGSGIFVGLSDPLIILMEQHYNSKILISKVPKRLSSSVPLLSSDNKITLIHNQDAHASNFNESVFIIDSSMNYFVNQLLTENLTRISNELMMNKFVHTSENFTCVINIMWKINFNVSDQSEFKFLSFAGKRNFSTASINNYVESCGISLCSKNVNGSCLGPPHFKDALSITIMSINIFSVSSVDAIVIPSTLDSNLLPLKVNFFIFKTSKVNLNNREHFLTEMNLIRPISNLVSFGFYKLPEKSNPDISISYKRNIA